MAFLVVNNFFCAFSKILNKITFVCSLFLKLNQSRNMKNKFFLVVFLQKPKTRFFGGKNKIVLKLKFKFVFLRLFFFVKGSFVPIFTNKY